MKKVLILFFALVCIFSVSTKVLALELADTEWAQLNCPKVVQLEDNLGNIGVNNIVDHPNNSAGPISSSNLTGSFKQGSLDTLIIRIIATKPDGLPISYRFSSGAPTFPYHDIEWSKNNSTIFDVSKLSAGATIHVTSAISTQNGSLTDDYCPGWGITFDYSVTNPIPTTCTSWTYSDWSSCLSNGQQTRSITSSSPNSCAGGSPVLTQSCTYTAPACTSWTYSNWSACSNNGQQTRSTISSSPTSCAGGSPVLTGSCTYVAPTCTSWIYSAWGVCADNEQNRTITSSQPTNCTGGNPTLNQSCNSTPFCTENNWTSVLTPTNCPSNGQQVKKWTKIGSCQNGISHSSEESASCNYQAPTCATFTYSDWGTCNASGVQSRSTVSSSPSDCVGGNPVLSQSCKYVPVEVPNKVSVVEIKNNLPVSINNEKVVNQEKTVTSSQVVEQRKSDVADAVQKIIQITDKNSEVGQQIKTITETQTQNQEELETSLQKVQSRSGFTKFFVGPDYGEINNAKKLLEQNREQIKQLDKVQNQLTNNSDKQKLTEQVQLLEQTNQEVENSLNTSQKGFSLFGWIFRLFTK